MKKQVLILLLLVSSIMFAQRKIVTDKLQVKSAKNAEMLKTDSRGNIVKSQDKNGIYTGSGDISKTTVVNYLTNLPKTQKRLFAPTTSTWVEELIDSNGKLVVGNSDNPTDKFSIKYFPTNSPQPSSGVWLSDDSVNMGIINLTNGKYSTFYLTENIDVSSANAMKFISRGRFTVMADSLLTVYSREPIALTSAKEVEISSSKLGINAGNLFEVLSGENKLTSRGNTTIYSENEITIKSLKDLVLGVVTPNGTIEGITVKLLGSSPITSMERMQLIPTQQPTTIVRGTIYFDSTDNKLKCWDGTAWHPLW